MPRDLQRVELGPESLEVLRRIEDLERHLVDAAHAACIGPQCLEVLRRIERHLAALREPDRELCPHCGSSKVEDTSVMGDPRRTCKACGRSWRPDGEDDEG